MQKPNHKKAVLSFAWQHCLIYYLPVSSFTTSARSVKISCGSIVSWLVRAAQRSAAAPCSHTAQAAASKGANPWASRAASIPASTSPLPPRARPEFPVGLCSISRPGAAISVPEPFSTATQPYRSASSCAAAGRSVWICATLHLSRRAASPGCGVSTVLVGKSGNCPSSPAASAFRASASSTAAFHLASAVRRAFKIRAALGPSPGPASRTAGFSVKRWRTAAASAARIPPSASVRQGRAQHSGVRVSTNWITGSTLARYTSPAPVRSAPSTQRAAAPR